MEDKRRRWWRRQEGLLAFGSLPLLLCDEARTMDGTQLVTQKEVSASYFFNLTLAHARAAILCDALSCSRCKTSSQFGRFSVTRQRLGVQPGICILTRNYACLW
jgi:hypothetical protein